MLTELQQQKMTHYFNVLDFNGNHIIEKADFEAVSQNLCILRGFREGTREFNRGVDLGLHQWESFQKFTGATDRRSSRLDSWLGFSNKVLVNGSDLLYDLYVKKIADEIFDTFDANCDDCISLDEFVDFFMAYRIDIRYSGKSFTSLDLNGDDRINRKEMHKAVHDFFRSNDKSAQGNWLFGFWG